MKILHVINRLGMGGAEKLLTELLPIQLQRGHEVVVVRLATGRFEFVDRLEKSGIVVVSLGKNENDIYNPLFVFKLTRYINHFDIVHVHLFPCQYWTAFAALLTFSKTVLITTEHNTDNRRRKLFGFKWIDKFVYKRYRKIIAISDKTAEALVNYLGCDDRICVVENGIDIARIARAKAIEKKDFGCTDNDKLILQVARFSEQKDQDTLIRCLKLLPASYHAVFVGDGARRTICETLAIHEGVKDRVHFLGVRNDVPCIIHSVDVVVMSSHWEGFGLAAVEGMAAGKPVIASDVPGLSEVVKGAGVLFEQGNVKMLSEQINALLTDGKYYEEIAHKCLLRAQRYDIYTMEKQYEEIYQSVMKK